MSRVTDTVTPFSAVGNEANVEVYANYTGFMWESAKEFGALVVFAEVCQRDLQAHCLLQQASLCLLYVS